MKIAVLADLHLTDNFNTVKMPAFMWALEEIKTLQVDCVCCIGDLTAQGSDLQSAEVIRLLNTLPVSWCSTPGNAEVRIFPDGKNARKFDVPPPDGIPLLLVNTAWDEPDAEALAQISALPDNANFLLATHNPVTSWSAQAFSVVESACQRGSISGMIAGHSHHDAPGILRGLDPDKASGGAPMFALMEQLPDGSWQRQDYAMPGVKIEDWHPAERAEFKRHIGFTTMWEEFAALDFASRYGVENVELRLKIDENCDITALQHSVARWRQSGGKLLSLHLPDLLPDDGGNLRRYAEFARLINCDRVTLHVPVVTAADFAGKQEILLKNFAQAMQPLLEAQTVIGIENLHTSAEKNTFETRNYGCTIEECRSWIMLLREKFSTDKIGFHFDVGHARNNMPISGRENLSDWYACMGDLINGWHLHQVEHKQGKFLNHMPLTGFYDKLIVLTGLFMAARSGQLKAVPMFLESRTWQGNMEAYTKLMDILK